VEKDIEPYVTEWDEKKEVPPEIYKEMGRRGYLAGLLGTHYQKDYTDNVVQCVPVEKWDLFHELIVTDELSRTGSGGEQPPSPPFSFPPPSRGAPRTYTDVAHRAP
jgi:hypothetical protein